jgi:ABC-type branched-subunit amino acid transport system ATPase component
MKLTNKDKDYLISIGYINEDFAVIENTTIRYELVINDVSIKINQREIVKILGRNNFLTGIGRATFHASAMRHIESIPNVFVYFSKVK